MPLRLIIFFVFIMFFNHYTFSQTYSQTYFDLIIEPLLFNKVYSFLHPTELHSMDCLDGDSLLQLQLKIVNRENGNISVVSSPIGIGWWETYVVFDSLKRVDKYGVNNKHGSEMNLSYKYFKENIIEIAHSRFGKKESITTLRFNDSGDLQEFHQMKFYDNDSVYQNVFEVTNDKNEITITEKETGLQEKLIFDDKHRFTAKHMHNKPYIEVNYDESGKITERIHYFNSIKAPVQRITKFYYDDFGFLERKLIMIFDGQGLIETRYCSF